MASAAGGGKSGGSSSVKKKGSVKIASNAGAGAPF